MLLDTNVISELAKASPGRAVVAWFETIPEEELRLSVLTLGEIRKGADLLDAGARRDAVARWLEGLSRIFADRILPVDEPVALGWGALCASARRAGRARPPIDSLLAATAIVHKQALATRNVKDFEGTGVLLVNPWEFGGGTVVG